MDNPKISVLIPLYNRQRYITDCVDSVLNQTFQDFEIIIRDDCSTDGVYEFVKEHYAKQISNGKIKLLQNEMNVGEYGNVKRLFKDASGKYTMVLHEDDMYLPHALQHLYEVAETTNADVVHCSYFLRAPDIIEKDTQLPVTTWETHPVKELTLVPNDSKLRFIEYAVKGTFPDIQYNIFNREFVIKNDIVDISVGFSSLMWLMKAKIIIKTPVVCYVYRDAKGSAHYSKKLLQNWVARRIETVRALNMLFSQIEFFKDNKKIQDFIKTKMLLGTDFMWFIRREIYKNGIPEEFFDEVEENFQKYLGDDYFYPAILFHWVHLLPYGIDIQKNMLDRALKSLQDNTSTPTPTV